MTVERRTGTRLGALLVVAVCAVGFVSAAELDEVLKNYLDGVIKNKNRQLSTGWFAGFKGILDAYLGPVPGSFEWNGKSYTPRSFADEVVGLDADDYVFFTSYTHHPFYRPFVLEVPDNGNLVCYVTGDEMLDILAQNWPGGALAQPTLYQIGFHNNFSQDDFQRLIAPLDAIDAALLADDLGPAAYARISDLNEVWKVPTP